MLWCSQKCSQALLYITIIFLILVKNSMANEISTYTYEGTELPFEDWSNKIHSFNDLASIVQTTHDAAQSSAIKAINRMQTMRNWLIGYYIVEFEQHGKDRAEYGTQLLKKLEERVNRKGVNVTLFKNSRRFYLLYPQMAENLISVISPTPSDQLAKRVKTLPTNDTYSSNNQQEVKSPTLSDQFKTSGKKIISSLSFSHIVELLTLDDPPCPLLLRAGVHQVHMVGSRASSSDKYEPIYQGRYQQQSRENVIAALRTRSRFRRVANTSTVHLRVSWTESEGNYG